MSCSLLEAGKYSDLTIICGPKKFAVHRAIICSRSRFFDGACTHAFREAETGIIDLSDDDPEAVEQMIECKCQPFPLQCRMPHTELSCSDFYRLDYLSSPALPTNAQTNISPFSLESPFVRSLPQKLDPALVEDPLLATAAASPLPAHNCPKTSTASVASEYEHSSAGTALTKNIGAPKEVLTLNIPQDVAESPVEQVPVSSDPHLVLHARVYALADK
jgi:hypothetical protein